MFVTSLSICWSSVKSALHQLLPEEDEVDQL